MHSNMLVYSFLREVMVQSYLLFVFSRAYNSEHT